MSLNSNPCSDRGPGHSDSVEFHVFLVSLLVDALVVEAGEGRFDTVLLSHFEVLSEVLVSAPPVGPDHAQSLVSQLLMEVGVPDVILLSVDGESPVSVSRGVTSVSLTDSVSPVLNHTLLLGLNSNVQHERLVKVIEHENPHNSHSVRRVERLHLPVHVGKGVLVESSNILESSPLLGHVSGLSGC